MARNQFNESDLTKIDAEYNLNNVLSSKEFWPVEGRNHENLYILQSTLDVIFNKCAERPRIYIASTIRFQNSTRLNIQCKVCNKDLSSYDPFMGHDKGKLHKKAVQQYLNEDTSNPNISGTAEFRKWDDPNECFYFSKGSLEEKLSQTSHHVLGHQFVYKCLGEEIYFCQLCYSKRHPPKRMNKVDAFQHIIGEKHILKFLKVKYNRNYERYEDAVTDVYFENMLKIEGRISSNILEAHCITDGKRKQEWDCKPLCSSPCQQGTPTEQDSETIEMFMERLLELKNGLHNNDGLVALLQNDSDAYDLIIVLLKILTQKFCTYSKNYDVTFLESATKLMEKIYALKIPPTPSDMELD